MLKHQQSKYYDHKPSKDSQGNIVNPSPSLTLPPGLDGQEQQGTIQVRMGDLRWFNYDGVNYLEELNKDSQKPRMHDLYAHIKFWGEDQNSKGIYLKFNNTSAGSEGTAGSNSYSYQVCCNESMLEQYLDDMGSLVVDFYDSSTGYTVSTSQVITNLFIKRRKRRDDPDPLIDLRQTYAMTLIGDHAVQIGEFEIEIKSQFGQNNNINQNYNKMQDKRQVIDLGNEDTFEMNEQRAREMTEQMENRVPSSLVNPTNQQYDGGRYPMTMEQYDQRPVRDRPTNKIQNSNLPAQSLKKDFGSRNQIDIDENEESQQNFMEILKRGQKLQAQMDDALDDNKRTPWEQLHGVHNLPKTYVPPFMNDGFGQQSQKPEEKIDLNEMEALMDLPLNANVPENTVQDPVNTQKDAGNEPMASRQILDMRYIYIKINQLKVEDQELVQKCINESFRLYVKIPLPDVYSNTISSQNIQLNNYEVLSYNEFDFNSTSSFNFRVNPETLAQFVDSSLIFCLQDQNIVGEMKMNQLILAKDFDLYHTCELYQSIEKEQQDYGRVKKKKEDKEYIQKLVGTIQFRINLQSENQEEEARRNFQLKLQQVEEQQARQEMERQEMAKKKLQFVMEQAPVFGQLYLHIERLGHLDNIGKRSNEMLRASIHQEDQEEQDPKRVEASQEGLGSTLNNRATGTEEEIEKQKAASSETLQRDDKETGQLEKSKKKLVHPKRNYYVKYKSFPNLEVMQTGPVWQQDEDSVFGYRAQFPVIMTPETLEKMEKFTFVLELWDQVSPSVSEFLGLVKVPLAPITYSMKTTDEEIFSLNFMADQFCLYPMIVSDGFLPVYSPKQGQNIGHLKLTLAMGSPIQVNRLIAKEQEEEKRKAAEAEKIRLLEAQKQIELELKEQRRLKKEQQRLEEERKRKEEEEQANPLDSLLGMGAQASAKRGTSAQRAAASQIAGAQLMNNKNLAKSIAPILRQSLNSQLSADYDQRDRNMLNCMRKLFEEARTQNIEELNSEAIFKDEVKNFEGKVHKDEVIYTYLNHESFSLTRAELAQIIQLMMDINRDDQGQIDIDELHFSYVTYMKYYELIEQRIVDLLEKFKISISKKFDTEQSMQQLTADIESKATDSKIPLIELRSIVEDTNGVQIRDALYDQLMQFFDLDRDQQVYITSFCDYLKNPSSTTINYFKVNKAIISGQIADYVKNSLETQPDCIMQLEEEFKKEIWKQVRSLQKDGDEVRTDADLDIVPPDLLLKEKINAKLFQYKLKRQGVALSLWEVFTFFDYLNTNKAKMFFEPQRYHQMMFQNFFEFIKNQPYNRGEVNKPPKDRSRSRGRSRSPSKGEQQMAYDIKQAGYNKYPAKDQLPAGLTSKENDEHEGYWHKNDLSDTEDPRQPYRQIKHIFEIKVQELKNIPVLNKFICQIQNTSENQNPDTQYMNEDMRKSKHLLSNNYIQNVAVKYSFPLDEDEVLESDYLQLNKDALESQGIYNYNVSMDTVHTYVIGKDDSIKKVLELCQSRGGAQASGGFDDEHQVLNSQNARREELFNISIALYQDNREFIVGNAHLPIEDLIDTIEQYQSKSGTYSRQDKKTHLNRTIFLYGTSYSQRENCIIGKLVLDLQYSQEKLVMSKKEAQAYALQQEKKENTIDEFNQSPFSCFMHRETYVNRKIPLNAKLSVLIDRVSNLKESIENIEHFAKIQHSANARGFGQEDDLDYSAQDMYKSDLGNLGMTSMVHRRKNMQHLDRRRVLKHILKNGLNLIVNCSVFEEDQELVSKFDTTTQAKTMTAPDAVEPPLGNLSRYKTRMLFNSLNPVFGEVFELNLQMNTKIFEYLKNKRAVFEVRHYIIESQKQKVEKMRRSQTYGNDINERLDRDEVESQNTIMDEVVESQCDYLVLGYVRVPLIQLITKNNGVDGDFTIYDEFKQSMGSLKLRITLNHHNSQRPLYSTGNKIPNQVVPGISQQKKKQTLIEQSISFGNSLRTGQVPRGLAEKQKIILGLDFIELLIKNRKELTHQPTGHVSRFFLKYKFLNQVHQTRFLSTQTGNALSPLNILLDKMNLQKLSIQKSNFIEIDVVDQQQMEEAFGKPLQIQLWHKVESVRTYEKPVKEQMLGQFFVELNELPQIVNKRLKTLEEMDNTQPGKFQVFEGYFSLHDSAKDVLSSDRLGMRLFLFKKDENNQTLNVDDMNDLFNTYRPKIEEIIALKLDQSGKGYSDSEDLIQAVKDFVPDEYLAQKLIWFIKSSLQYKSVDKVFYSPLFGLPPPFFKYAKKFDQLEIVCKMNDELEQLDSGDNGFVPVNLFKNCLEDELNIKKKIVEDFVNGIRDTNLENSNAQSVTPTVKEQQTLDVNMITNSMKTSHIDYIVMLRKLAQFIEQNKVTTNASSMVHNRILDSIKEHENAQDISLFFEIDNGMRIKNPLSANEPPNAFVSMKPCFQYREITQDQFLQTNEIRANSYPTWNYRSKSFTMPLNAQNRQFLEDGGIIKFEVFHKTSGFGPTDMEVRESNHLIGVAFVPIKPLMDGNGKTRLTGLFDVVSKQTIYNQSVQSLSSLKDQEVTMGKIKVSVTSNLNIRKVLDQEAGAQTGLNQRQGVPYSNDLAFSSNVLNDPEKRSFSFGGNALGAAYGHNPYPSHSQNQTHLSPVKSVQSGYERSQFSFDANRDGDHVEIGNLNSQNFLKLDDSVRDYHQTLQTKSEQEIDHLHMLNMNDLDDLTKKLKQSMAVLDVTVPENAQIGGEGSRLEESPELANNRRRANTVAFGHQTFKTDAQQVTLSQQLNQFREAQQPRSQQREEESHLKKEKDPQVVNNPFASYNEKALEQLGDLDRAEASEQPPYLRPMPLSTITGEEIRAQEVDVRQQEVDTPELNQARFQAPKIDDMADFDEEEMQRIEKILRAEQKDE